MRAILAFALCTAAVVAWSAPGYSDDWSFYGRDAGGTRFSPLRQITPQNVAQLKPAWVFHLRDITANGNGTVKSGVETTPLVIDGKLYLTTSFNRVVALDPASGHLIWSYDPHIDKNEPYGDGLINRGLAAWRNPSASDCQLTVYEATLDARLIAVNGATGAACSAFGEHGQVNLSNVSGYRVGWYHMTSPPIVVDGVVIIGSAIDDNARADMPDGTVRGFDAITGRQLWSWEPLQRPANARSWFTGAANAWSIMSADPDRHLVYVPTGSASPDYYGGLRPGDDRWADSVVALDVRSGSLVWGFQLVHHNLWDYDTAAPPLRADIKLGGQSRAAVIAGNKTGMLYVLDAATGQPLLPIQERPVPQSHVPGEISSPTQPFSVTLPPLARQMLSPSDAWGVDEPGRTACQAIIEKASATSLFAPPSTGGGLAIPGAFGGINWSGFAWDARHQRLIVAVSNLPFQVQLIPSDQLKSGSVGDFRGEVAPQLGAPFAVARAPFLSPSHTPCVAPPWGELVSVDLSNGNVDWRSRVGTMRDVFPGIAGQQAGSVILGGPIVTESGVIFTGGTMDRRFHALSAESGEELWSADLPASAHAQPVTYETNGKQYVVIAAGGSAKIDEERQSDAVVAFSLP